MEFRKLKLPTLLKSTPNRLLIIVVILLAITIGLGVKYSIWLTTYPPEMEQVMVVRVIDGDTIELQDGRHVRYLGIDTPETGDFYADEATTRNKELVEGKVVELQRGKRDRDEYDRLLRYVYIHGVFVNAELVAQGYASAYIFDPDERYSQVIVQLEQYAKMRERGLWGNQ